MFNWRAVEGAYDDEIAFDAWLKAATDAILTQEERDLAHLAFHAGREYARVKIISMSS